MMKNKNKKNKKMMTMMMMMMMMMMKIYSWRNSLNNEGSTRLLNTFSNIQ